MKKHEEKVTQEAKKTSQAVGFIPHMEHQVADTSYLLGHQFLPIGGGNVPSQPEAQKLPFVLDLQLLLYTAPPSGEQNTHSSDINITFGQLHKVVYLK